MTAPDTLPGIDDYTTALNDARRDTYRPVAAWLLASGYPTEWHTDELPPTDVWDALVELVWEDPDGRYGARGLSREEVDAWLRYEASSGKTASAIQ